MAGEEARLASYAAAQRGAFTLEQARRAGFSVSQVERRVRAGTWRRVVPRVFRHALAPATDELLVRAALLWAGAPCALSHTTAARVWGVAVPPFPDVELRVPRARAPRTAGIVVHRVVAFERDVVRRHGLPVTTLARTLVDLAAVLDDDAIVAAARSVVALGPAAELAVRARLAVPSVPGQPGVRRLSEAFSRIPSDPSGRSDRMAG